jgi:hypothetical protein
MEVMDLGSAINEVTESTFNAKRMLSKAKVYGTKEEKIGQLYSRGGMALSELSEAVKQASVVIEHHANLFGLQSQRAEAKSIDVKNGRIELVFGCGEESFSVVYDVFNKTWGNSSSGESKGELIDSTGLSSDYLQGMVDALNIFARSRILDKLIDDCARRVSLSVADSLNGNRPLMQLFRSQEYLHSFGDLLFDEGDAIEDKIKDVDLRRKQAELSRFTRSQTARFAMPDVPGEKCSAACFIAQNIKPFSGIYFGWVDGVCVYVGKSINVQNRIRTHTTITRCEGVSWIVMPESDIHHAELFYIWLMRPSRNSETNMAVKRKLAQ